MTITKTIASTWNPEQRLITTQLSGEVDQLDIAQWEEGLQQALSTIEDNGSFKIFVNLHGFKAVNINAHKQFREIVPSILAQYGWKVGYLNLFEEAADLPLTRTRGIACVGAAHVHQDETKIALYDSRFGTDRERFFTDPLIAEEWIKNLKQKTR